MLKPKLWTTLSDYSKEQFFKDLIAGVIVAIIALPLSIALAIASGVSPERGLYTAIVAGFFISMLGGSRVQIGGPTGAFMVIVYGIVMEFGLDGLILATLMAGMIMILMGLLKLGSVIKFIPYPITMGFTSGIAVVIFSSQIKDFLGLPIQDVPVEFIAKWRTYLGALELTDPLTLFVGALSLVVIVLWPRVNQRIPGALVAILLSSALVQVFHLDVATVGTRFGELSSNLPVLSWPALSWDKAAHLLMPALTIAMLGSIESLLSAVVSDGMIGGKHRSNMELVAQGIANMMSALFGGIPATGAIARTVANVKNGGRTPVAGMVHAVTLLLILRLFMPWARLIPLSTLAAILIMVAYNMSQWREFRELMRAPRSDILVLLVTFFITVFIDLVRAIEIGIVLASMLFMKRMAEVSHVELTQLDAAEEHDESYDFRKETQRLAAGKGIQIYEINGPFFFGAADKFLDALRQVGYRTHTLVIRMRNAPSMDATALQAFKTMLEICERRKIRVLVSEIDEQPLRVLKKAALYDRIGADHFFEEIDAAIQSAQEVRSA